jgi:hypothetical protein
MTVTPKPEAFNRLRSLAEATKITHADMAGPVLVRLGQVHRKQETAIFASEGALSAGGAWKALSPKYRARKAKFGGLRGILTLTGDMKSRLTGATNANYIQKYSPTGEATGTFSFGAASAAAAAHAAGNPALGDKAPQSGLGRRVFKRPGTSLPVRDPIGKTAAMLDALRQAFVRWYTQERIPQIARGAARLP